MTGEACMDLTERLREEHEVILEVLDALQAALARARDAGTVRAGDFRPFVEFFRDYADRCHHQKEEDVLFPALERHGFPHDTGPVGCMLEEHRAGRAHVSAMGEAVASAERGEHGDALATLLREGAAYVELLRAHIEKENQVLFVMAAEVLRGDDAAEVRRRFADIERDPAWLEQSRRGRELARTLAGGRE